MRFPIELIVVPLFVCAMAWSSHLRAEEQVLSISRFSERSIKPWTQHSFTRGTDYRLAQIDESGDWVLSAVSMGAASAFYRSVKIDLEQTPILSWRWRVEQPLMGLNEKLKSGDDYAARVYVVHKSGYFGRGMAVNYVWSGSNAIGASWPNAFAKNSSQMLALRDSSSPLAQWQSERRNIRDDFKRLFGKDVSSIEVVVLMTDTDNSGKTARAHYGDLVFSAR